ncbi:MAG: SAM-dependent methyltransferase, partial [Ktedonobacteraceae bacterium]
EEGERLTATVVAGRVRQAFDDERITKRFYDRFKTEHSHFLKFIQGITTQGDCEWYTSLMLNRLMFVYFIQRKGFLDTKTLGQLDGDRNYLTNRLKAWQQQNGRDSFHSFYRSFLLTLFHDGLSKEEDTRSPAVNALLGKVPYLNGGLFDVHTLERDYPEIQIADEAFEHIFDFFDEYDWHLDDRPLRKGNEINPDVLGYIFEKYINQKQMGAYYTKEDITEYISKNTIIPYIFDAAEQKCLIAFNAKGPVWSLLRENPDRYIYAAVKKGCQRQLLPEIENGIHDVTRRTEWNKPAPSCNEDDTEGYALPTEIWREVVARRTRYAEIKAKLAAGEVTSINDLITYNLDIRQFAQDVITFCEGSDLLLAFYESIEQVSILAKSTVFHPFREANVRYTSCIQEYI